MNNSQNSTAKFFALFLVSLRRFTWSSLTGLFLTPSENPRLVPKVYGNRYQSHACYMFPLSHSTLLIILTTVDEDNNLLTMQISLFSYLFLSPDSKYSPQHRGLYKN